MLLETHKLAFLFFLFLFATKEAKSSSFLQTHFRSLSESNNVTHVESSEHVEHDHCSPEYLNEQSEDKSTEHQSRFTIAIGSITLWLLFYCGYFLERKHILWFPEAGAGIIIGLLAGAIIVHGHSSEKMKLMVRFDTEFFFIFLLPPIIFESGYNMKRQAFFRNLGAICLYAFIGTTISCFVVGGLVYGFGLLGWCYPLGGLASLVFGALISATDPVTVLAVFQALHADIDLYSLVFGESVLNDAVAIVLYRTLANFRCGLSLSGIFVGFGSFLLVFVGSTLIGIAVGFISAIFSKYSIMQDHDEYLFLETGMLCIYPYAAFMISEALGLSGIVAILFCGITMAQYTYENLSSNSQTLSRQLFKVLAFICESFVFVYLGMAMFTYPQTYSLITLILLSFLACLIARLFNVYPNTILVNIIRRNATKKPLKISPQYQFILWFSGLRGAVAFVLAVSSYNSQFFHEKHDPNSNTSDSDAILTVTLFIAIITVFSMGGPVAYLLKYFNALEITQEEIIAYTDTKLMSRDKSRPMEPRGAIYYDRKYLKPFFTHYKFQEIGDEVEEGNRVDLISPVTLRSHMDECNSSAVVVVQQQMNHQRSNSDPRQHSSISIVSTNSENQCSSLRHSVTQPRVNATTNKRSSRDELIITPFNELHSNRFTGKDVEDSGYEKCASTEMIDSTPETKTDDFNTKGKLRYSTTDPARISFEFK